MRKYKFHRSATNNFKAHQLDLSYNQAKFSEFINRPFCKTAIINQIKDKSENFSEEQRSILVKSLVHQYGDSIPDCTSEQLTALEDSRTFTITTGHQLSLATGPLYFVIKILHVIKLCKELRAVYPEYQFVPVYWMASEDHDFEEIQSVSIYNKQLTWNTEQTGPVGRFDLDQFEDFKNEFGSFFKANELGEIHNLLKTYTGENLAKATRSIVAEMFGELGLVIIDGDDENLKRSFHNVIENELTNQFSYPEVINTSEKLNTNGVPSQVNPREINLFYIQKGIRSRIELFEEGYRIKGVTDFIDRSSLLKELESNPERFSPNVILRPVYQEYILPNLVYIGGTGEISYWLQLKGVFDSLKLTYPMIQVRNSVMWIDSNTTGKIKSLGIALDKVFDTTDSLKHSHVKNNTSEDLDFAELNLAHENLKSTISTVVLKSNSRLDKFVGAENKKLEKQIDAIKSKLVREEKSKFEKDMKTIEQVKNRLFPNGGLQERVVNFFNFCPDGDYKGRLSMIYDAVEPFEDDFIVLVEE